MSAEFPGEGGHLPNFLPVGQRDPLFTFKYQAQLEEQCLALPPQQEGEYRASVVTQCPTDNEGWERVGVKADYAEDAYSSIVLSTIANGARDSEVTASMLGGFSDAGDVLKQRISPKLASTIATRTLNTTSANPEAVANIVSWALDFVPDPEMQTSAVSVALIHKTPEQLSALLPVLERLGQSEMAEGVVERLREYEERARQHAEEQRRADEARAAEAARRQAEEARRDYIRDNPIQAFEEIMESQGLASTQNVGFEEITDGGDELLFAAGVIESQIDMRSLARTEGNAATVDFARTLLDKTVNLRRHDAARFSLEFGHEVASILDRHEDRTVTSAASVEDFWNRVSQLAEWRDQTTLDKSHVSRLYEQWRSSFIARRQQERAAAILREQGINPNANFTPEGFHDFTVVISHGTVSYDSLDELIDNMRSYFVPRMNRLEAGVVAAGAVENAVGSTALTSMLSKLNPGGDEEIMDRLETEIRSWAHQRKDDPYQDSQDYGGGLFTGHGIGITRDSDGKFQLSLQGRGYNYYSSQPTKQIDDFAAYIGKDVDYKGSIQLEYTAEPPVEFEHGTITRTIRGETGVEDAVAVSLNIGSALRQVQTLLGLSNEAVERLMQIVESNPRGTDIPGIREGGIVVGVSPYHGLPREMRRSADGSSLEGYSAIVTNDGEQERYFFLPDLGLHVQSTDANLQSELNRVFHAVSVISRNGPRKAYPNGYVGGYKSFKPNVAI